MMFFQLFKASLVLLCLFLGLSWARCPPGGDCRYERVDGIDFNRVVPGIPQWFCADLYDLCRQGNLFTHDFCFGKYLCCAESKAAFQYCRQRGFSLHLCHSRNWVERVSQMCYWTAEDGEFYRRRHGGGSWTRRRRYRYY